MIRSKLLGAFLVLLAVSLLPGARRLEAGIGLPQVMVFEQSWRGVEGKETRWPVALAASSSGEIAVADAYGSRLLVFRRAGVSWTLSKVLSLPGPPVSVAKVEDRYLVALRDGKGVVALEGADFLQRQHPLPKSVVPGPLAAAPGGGLYLYDYGSGREIVLSASGKVERTIDTGPGVSAIATGPDGSLFVAKPVAATIAKYGSSGGLEATWSLPSLGPVPAWPSAVAVTAGGEVLVADRHNGRILVLDANGRPLGQGSRRGYAPGLLRFPSGIAVLPEGGVVVTDEGNGRIQLFQRIQPGQGR